MHRLGGRFGRGRVVDHLLGKTKEPFASETAMSTWGIGGEFSAGGWRDLLDQLAERMPRLEFLGSRALLTGLPADRVALRAERDVTLPAGAHEMIVISDDGVRVWVDGALALERWDVHGSVVDRVPLTPGRHRIRLDYSEVTVTKYEPQVRSY